MKKNIICLLIISFIYLFENNVYAYECYRLLGSNNKIIIPVGTTATCEYEYARGTYNQNGYNNMKLVISEYNITIENSNESGLITYYSNSSSVQKMTNSGEWNGIKFENDDFSSWVIEVDENIQGCPSSFYWINKENTSDKILGFSASENPTLIMSKDSTYFVYKLSSESDINFVNDNPPDTDGICLQFSYGENKNSNIELYNYCKEGCGKINENKNKTSADIKHYSTETKTTTLVTCSYYFEFKFSRKSDCGVVKHDYSLIEEVTGDKKEYKLSYEESDGINFVNVQDAIKAANNDIENATEHLKDFFIYNSNDNSWSCPQNIYANSNGDNNPIVIGNSMYNTAKNMDGDDVVTLTADGSNKDDLCKGYDTKKDTDPRPRDDAGIPVYTCEDLIGPNVLHFLKLIRNFIMIIGPILALVLGTYDLIVAMASGEDDAKKKGMKNMKNRIVAAVLLLLVPYILMFILNIVNKGWSSCV